MASESGFDRGGNREEGLLVGSAALWGWMAKGIRRTSSKRFRLCPHRRSVIDPSGENGRVWPAAALVASSHGATTTPRAPEPEANIPKALLGCGETCGPLNDNPRPPAGSMRRTPQYADDGIFQFQNGHGLAQTA